MLVIDENVDLAMIDKTFGSLRKAVMSLKAEPIKNRIDRLEKLRSWVHANRGKIHKAAFEDFRKPAAEVDGTEIFHVLSEIKLAIENVERWAQPRKIDAPITMLGTRSFIQHEPRGTCLILSPWNYPFSLAVGPLVSALAAGNNVILKPSELTPNVSALIRRMSEEIFDPNVVVVIEGGVDVSQKLLSLPFDHIFFTGSPAIGKVVMRAAAEHLTSVTLELGGKSPTVVTGSANIQEAALRIAVAKFVNNGQTCVAPDYILAEKKIADELVQALITQTKKLFLGSEGSFETSSSYCRIINQKHFDRLTELIQDAIAGGAKIKFSGDVNREDRFIHPVIMTDVSTSSRLMEEEIFGPLLPIVTYENLEEAIRLINSKPKALALYIFSNRSSDHNKILTATSSGGVCINECAIHFLHHNLPFGGVNNSGIGKSHGHYGFLAFSNEKPVMKQRHGWTTIQPFYPPYTVWSQRLMDWFLKLF
jgi:aldehyde dehydrogenase (NAD+)